jgi:hypothetical protein
VTISTRSRHVGDGIDGWHIAFRYDYRLSGGRNAHHRQVWSPVGISLALAREKLLDAKQAIAEECSPAHERRRLTVAKIFGDMIGR